MNPTDIAESAQQAGLPASVTLPTCNVADKAIENGTDARCFAQYMRIHALESTGGLTYAQMGRYALASDPSDAKGTNDPTAAAKDEKGQPIANGLRNTWVTETALATALNVSYMAEQIALFGLVVGIALLLSGIGFIILALIVLGTAAREEAARRRGRSRPRLRRADDRARDGTSVGCELERPRTPPSTRRRESGVDPTGCSDLPEHEGAAKAAPSPSTVGQRLRPGAARGPEERGDPAQIRVAERRKRRHHGSRPHAAGAP